MTAALELVPAAISLRLVEAWRSGQLHGVRRKGHEAGVTAASLTLAVEALALATEHRLRRDLVADRAAPAAAAIDRGHGCSPYWRFRPPSPVSQAAALLAGNGSRQAGNSLSRRCQRSISGNSASGIRASSA